MGKKGLIEKVTSVLSLEDTGGCSLVKKWRKGILRGDSKSKGPEAETSMGHLRTE